MELTVVEGLQSGIYVPITPSAVFTAVTKPVKESVVAFLTAGGVHLKAQEPFALAGDFGFREIPSDAPTEQLIDRLRELEKEGFIGKVAPRLVCLMSGGGNIKRIK